MWMTLLHLHVILNADDDDDYDDDEANKMDPDQTTPLGAV